jgi:hypothetical protein
MEKITDTKIIISGSTLEVYKYKDKPVLYDFVIPEHFRKRRKTKILVIDEESRLRKMESRKKGMRRAQSILRRLINSNAWRWYKPNNDIFSPVFITLTFAKNVQDTKTANFLFSKFIKRLTYHIGEEKKSFLKYVVVTEFQKRGAIHYHAIFFNLKFIDSNIFAKIWKQGFVKLNLIDHVTNVGAYVCKYMCKEFEDDRLDGKKRYFSSRGLKKPVVIREQTEARRIFSLIPKELIKFESKFGGHMGKVEYTQCQIEKERSFNKVIPELYDNAC